VDENTPEPEPAVPDTDTARLEAFSDGVFAVAITLLVLNVGAGLSTSKSGHLPQALLRQWPEYLAYLISFLFILIMWTNHHTLFRYIRRSDHTLLLLNGLLLLFITLVPFPTGLLATYLRSHDSGDQLSAVLVYNGTYVLIAIAFNLLWWYALHNRRLLDEAVHPRHLQAMTDDYRYGVPLYLVAFALAFFNVWLSLAMNVGLALFWALPRSRSRKRRSPQA
jgi:uncharacterized membrane protein